MTDDYYPVRCHGNGQGNPGLGNSSQCDAVIEYNSIALRPRRLSHHGSPVMSKTPSLTSCAAVHCKPAQRMPWVYYLGKT